MSFAAAYEKQLRTLTAHRESPAFKESAKVIEFKPERRVKVIRYSPWDYQLDFHRSRKAKVYLSSGFGGGKTYSLIQKMFQLMGLNPGLPGGILAPSLKMYKKDVVPTIQEICDENDIAYTYNKSDMEWYFPLTQTRVYVFHSEDDGESIRGPNLAWGIVNEVSRVTERAFKMFLGRVRLKKAMFLQIAMSGTPEGFNWTYEYFVQDPRDDTDLIFGDARKNTHVNESYFAGLADSYDELMQQAYIEGRFVNMVGKTCAWAFNRFRHTDSKSPEKVTKIPGAPVYVTLDFNVAPMAATLWNWIPLGVHPRTGEPLGQQLRAWAELGLDNSNTYAMCDAIKGLVDQDDVITIFPDPAGRSRTTKTRDNRSDLTIITEQFQNYQMEMKYKSSLSVRSCLLALNNILAKDMVMLSTECRNTVADLEQCVFKGGTFEIDKSNSKRSHWLDGVKNMADYLFPIKTNTFREERLR